jgi:hypothetical protein
LSVYEALILVNDGINMSQQIWINRCDRKARVREIRQLCFGCGSCHSLCPANQRCCCCRTSMFLTNSFPATRNSFTVCCSKHTSLRLHCEVLLLLHWCCQSDIFTAVYKICLVSHIPYFVIGKKGGGGGLTFWITCVNGTSKRYIIS